MKKKKNKKKKKKKKKKHAIWVKEIKWVFLNSFLKFLIISLDEDAGLTFKKNIGADEINVILKNMGNF